MKVLYEEIIDEIGTQSLARLGLNIFSLNTYKAYEASVRASNEVSKSYHQHQKNDKFYGYAFEALDVGGQNIKDALFNTGHKSYTTGTLAEIQNAQAILGSGKKIENLEAKDRDKIQHILANYADEVEKFDFTQGALAEFAKTNHTTTDTITFNSGGEVIKTSQLKVVKNTNDLLKDRYLQGEGAVDELKVPFDDYQKHRAELEKMIKRGESSSDEKIIQKAQKAKIALEKLNENNLCNRLMCENPRATATIAQSITASSHIIQAGMSDAIVVALSTLANGVIYELKDMFESRNSQISVMDRMKRLITKVIDSIKNSFQRGAGFGAIDAVMGIIGQIFNSIALQLKRIWDHTRTSAKSIYNALSDYISGKIATMQELLKVTLKALFSAVWVVGIAGLEKKLELLLPFGIILAPALAIVIAAFMVVMTAKSIDFAIDTFFASFAAKEKAKIRAEELAKFVCENLPALIEEREEIEALIQDTHRQRLLSLEASFLDYKKAYENCDDDGIYEALSKVNELYHAKFEKADPQSTLEKPNRTGKLKW